MSIGRLLVAVACAMVLTAPSTAAATSVRHHRPAVMTMEYSVGDLRAVVHSPRTLVGTRPLVFQFHGYDEVAESLARQGSVVVLVSDRTAVDRHLELWRSLSKAEGPLAERFRGFAGHFTVAEP
ncbi:hypothetical protein UK23_29000 [Lentzea aerocolonigenes]|uniref:Uncharacterized protein n=1 Tax=Lentzea aerocolonigenes TaxID=68170 RepID=A0A0F0GRF3_LENAE|nr:hypothetical protein [Lentzea aerocolonigenes]KJK44537.1 hypothetical protein UK23_29000 [Lentzea aerocolonigenes]